jgi:hypothetical protein
VAGTTLTFSAAPPSGTANISVRFLGIPASGVTTTAYRTLTEFTATASQTTFTPPSYTVGYINVFRNGVMLGTADYTASNGTTVVLASAASAGDLVVTESFYVSSVLNAIPGTAGSVGTTYLVDGSVTPAKLSTGGPSWDASSNLTVNGLLNISAATAGQIQFPATQNPSSNANTLDDYEEGTWTPTLSFGTASVGITYGTQVGNYVKVGKWVTITFNIAISTKGSSTGGARVSGMPFVNYTSLQLSAGSLQGERNMTSFNQTNAYCLMWNDGYIYLRYNGGSGYVDFNDTFFNNGSCIYGCLTYQTID